MAIDCSGERRGMENEERGKVVSEASKGEDSSMVPSKREYLVLVHGVPTPQFMTTRNFFGEAARNRRYSSF